MGNPKPNQGVAESSKDAAKRAEEQQNEKPRKANANSDDEWESENQENEQEDFSPSKSSLPDFEKPTTRGVYYQGYIRPEKPGTVPNMAAFRKEMYDSLEHLSQAQFKNVRSLESQMKRNFLTLTEVVSTELGSMKELIQSNNSVTQDQQLQEQLRQEEQDRVQTSQRQFSSAPPEAPVFQGQRVQRDDDMLNAGRPQMTENQAL